MDRTYDDLIVSGRYSQEVFARTIADVLLQLIPLKRRSGEFMWKAMEADFEKHRKLNRIRRAKTELGFIMSNFFQFLFDGKYRFHERLGLLVKGFRRYVLYFLPRIKNHS